MPIRLTLVAKCRVAASAPRGGANNVAYGKTGRAAAAIGTRIPTHRAPRSGAYKKLRIPRAV
jgi:hypothetical protein